MKILFFTFSLLLSFSNLASDKLADLYSETIFSINKRINLSEGQKSLLVANRACRLHFPREAEGLMHIPAKTKLVVSNVKFSPMRDSFNPQTGAPIKVHPSVQIAFRGTSAKIKCRHQDAAEMTITDMESDGIFSITPPTKSTPYLFN